MKEEITINDLSKDNLIELFKFLDILYKDNAVRQVSKKWCDAYKVSIALLPKPVRIDSLESLKKFLDKKDLNQKYYVTLDLSVNKVSKELLEDIYNLYQDFNELIIGEFDISKLDKTNSKRNFYSDEKEDVTTVLTHFLVLKFIIEKQNKNKLESLKMQFSSKNYSEIYDMIIYFGNNLRKLKLPIADDVNDNNSIKSALKAIEENCTNLNELNLLGLYEYGNDDYDLGQIKLKNPKLNKLFLPNYWFYKDGFDALIKNFPCLEGLHIEVNEATDINSRKELEGLINQLPNLKKLEFLGDNKDCFGEEFMDELEEKVRKRPRYTDKVRETISNKKAKTK